MNTNNHFKILHDVACYYSNKIEQHGVSPQGVDWNSVSSQELRFAQLIKPCENDSDFTINDLGCGYGALYDYLVKRDVNFKLYYGIDVSCTMIKHALDLHEDNTKCRFDAGGQLKVADYSICSGIFNVKLQHNDTEWQEYVLSVLNDLHQNSIKGFAFNCLTKYSDKEKKRNDLYYADPCFVFDFCKRNFSKNVALLHDYGLYEFTIIVRGNK